MHLNSTQKRSVRIKGTGKYLPQRLLTSAQMDQQFSLIPGTIEKKSGIKKRHVMDINAGETIVQMAAAAARDAVKNANLTLNDIDCLVFAGGVCERLIPCTASLIHRELELDARHIPAFDINSTCVSFVVALDTLSYTIDFGKYQNVLIVSADAASVGLNPKDMATYIILGDGAAAAVVSKSVAPEKSAILGSLMKTYSMGTHLCDLSLGLGHIPRSSEQYNWENYTFRMDGKGIYKLIGDVFPAFLTELLGPLRLRLTDIDMIVPHQASNIAIQSIRDGLGVPAHKIMDIYSDHANQVASSVPMALHEGISQNKIQRGNTVLLLGTSAGVSLSGLVFSY